MTRRRCGCKGNVYPLAKAAYDQGAVADSQPMTRMMLLLQRSAAQELALRQVMDAQQTKGLGRLSRLANIRTIWRRSMVHRTRMFRRSRTG